MFFSVQEEVEKTAPARMKKERRVAFDSRRDSFLSSAQRDPNPSKLLPENQTDSSKSFHQPPLSSVLPDEHDQRPNSLLERVQPFCDSLLHFLPETLLKLSSELPSNSELHFPRILQKSVSIHFRVRVEKELERFLRLDLPGEKLVAPKFDGEDLERASSARRKVDGTRVECYRS